MTPDLYTLVMAAKQIAGDQYALHVTETARQYPYTADLDFERIAMESIKPAYLMVNWPRW